MSSKYVPSKQLSTRHNLPWFDKKAKSLVRLKQKLYNSEKLTGDTNDWQKYRNVKKSTNHHLKRSHRHHVNSKLSDALENNYTKPFWSYIKSLRDDNNGVAPIKAEGKLHSIQKANLLNKQFQSVFVKEDHKIPVPKLGDTTAPTIGDLKITPKGVEKQLSTLNINKASGPDQIPNTFLKQIAKGSASVLTALFTQLLQTGNLPDDWLSANVSPIFKKGDRGLASNYRPVSLTWHCVCCKLMEHILVRHMLRHFDNANIISDKQHGFRKGQLITTVNDLLASADVGNRVDIAILDFSKAFDMVSHRRLMSKLDHYGIRGNIHKWISSFLNNRNQKVVIDGYSSDTISVDSGVPQG